MGKWKGIRNRTALDSLVAYVSDGDEESMKARERDLYQEQIDEAYKKFFSTMDQILHADSRENNCLSGAIVDFDTACKDAYFQAGIVAGFRIYKNLDQEYSGIKNDRTIKAVIQEIASEFSGS